MSRTRVVVVGHGMVGSRFVEELVGRDTAGRFRVTVLGAEPYPPYNRVLLSDVVAGRTDVASLTLPEVRNDRAAVRAGVTAVEVDRAARRVLDSDGLRHAYDVLVLATGAAARIPSMPGLDPAEPPSGVHVLRSLDDARQVVAATVNARAAVVLGGGVLGLEAACGLAARGLAVTVVNAGPHLMERQLDDAAAGALANSLARLGVSSRAGVRTTGLALDDGRFSGLVADGEPLPADLLLLACGTAPELTLARSCGLDVDRGVLVGDDLASPTDPRVFALGDCAQPPEGSSGLVAQGWEQARRLAAALASGDRVAPPDAPGQDVVRLKASGVDVVAMGAAGPAAPPQRARVLRMADPDAGRHVEVVVRGGELLGAVCVGDPRLAADLVSTFTRGTPLPSDPAQLLVRPVAGATQQVASPTLMPDRATVCRCNGVTKGQVVACWRSGSRTVGDVARGTRATTGCGGCRDAVSGLLDWMAAADAGADASQPAGGAGEEVVAAAKQQPPVCETCGS